MNRMSPTLADTILVELEQSADEGRLVQPFAEEAKLLFEMNKNGYCADGEAKELFSKIKNAPVREDYPYVEPSQLDDIKSERPKDRNAAAGDVDIKTHYDKVFGAWLGRCCGCLLGKPVEGWYRDRLTGMLKDTGNYPINKYLASDVGAQIREKYSILDERPNSLFNPVTWINNVSCMPEDDDTNYTVLYLKTVDTFGKDFTSDDVGTSWLFNLPALHAMTAERLAYRNLVNNIPPPLSGSYNNAFREWVGAQIRADFFGYLAPGNPEKAAEYAWRDGRVSHTKNGIYGEMFCAAMLARAAVSSDIQDIIRHGLGEIPAKSRLAEGIKKVLGWWGENIGWEEALDNIHKIYDEKINHHWCHTISNAMICALALLWGRGDFEKTIGIAVTAAFDTDCNAATTGSVMGMILGANRLPQKWVSPLNGKVITGIHGYDLSEISGLAKKTIDLILK